jgi:hypothetical protein
MAALRGIGRKDLILRGGKAMVGLKRFLFKFRNFAKPGRAEQDLAREIRSHLDLLEDDFRQRGMSAESAIFQKGSAKQPLVLTYRDLYTCAGHWCEHGHFQLDQRADA